MRPIMVGVLAMLCGFVVALKANRAEAANCQCWGYYTCSTTLEQYDYDEPFCGGVTKPAALGICQNACGGGTCVDSGWLCG